MFETLLITAVVPAVLDFVKGAGAAASRRWLGLSIDDEIKLNNAGVERLKALVGLDNPYGTPSQWVVDLRASFRYIAAAVLILVGASITAVGAYQYSAAEVPLIDAETAKQVILIGLETPGQPFAFIFGERMWTGLRGMLK